ncbi:MAG: hypothetical protein E6G42_07760 [Actinobacteria bacterium]|nr:MAG: hypothetical protein E6G42_07760 [Actinomycetota bacterium]
MPRLLALSYFAPSVLPRLLRAAGGAGLPANARVYVGSYGVGGELADAIENAGYRYAPMFHLKPSWYWERRRLPQDTANRSLAGPLPDLPELLRLSTAPRVRWGVELGARFRDAIRAAEDAGATVQAWQLDEIQAEAAGGQGRQYREFTRGVLSGLLSGRTRLGDRPRQGLVWWAHTAFTLPRRPVTPELSAFWRILNRSCLGLLGEEYPEFVGDPRAAARAEASGQRALQQGGPVRQALARKYVAAMTPGYHLAAGLGGNTRGLAPAEVDRWRESYVAARDAAAVAGFAEFDFRFGNNRLRVMQAVLHALARHL